MQSENILYINGLKIFVIIIILSVPKNLIGLKSIPAEDNDSILSCLVIIKTNITFNLYKGSKTIYHKKKFKVLTVSKNI